MHYDVVLWLIVMNIFMIHLAIKSSAFVAEKALKDTLSARLLRYHGRLVEHISVLTILNSSMS